MLKRFNITDKLFKSIALTYKINNIETIFSFSHILLYYYSLLGRYSIHICDANPLLHIRIFYFYDEREKKNLLVQRTNFIQFAGNGLPSHGSVLTGLKVLTTAEQLKGCRETQ